MFKPILTLCFKVHQWLKVLFATSTCVDPFSHDLVTLFNLTHVALPLQPSYNISFRHKEIVNLS